MADESITIAIIGMVQSLNVSIASALVLYKALHQRKQAGMHESSSLDDENTPGYCSRPTIQNRQLL